MRIYDYKTAQPIVNWIANSENTKKRIFKFYRKEAKVIYPPCDVEKIIKATRKLKRSDYFLIVSRLVGAKGLEEAAAAARKSGFKLKIVGEAAGYSDVAERLKKMAGGNIELLGRVTDEKLYELYGKAQGFIALAKDEDFGMTVVEAQAAGTPVIAYNGGGFKESVIDGKTGLLIDRIDRETLENVVSKFSKLKWKRNSLINNARKFSKEQFIFQFKGYLKKIR
jgi:glycosyltransferase involved in cell wall biosynthesis